jgi:hypothetical protein
MLVNRPLLSTNEQPHFYEDCSHDSPLLMSGIALPGTSTINDVLAYIHTSPYTNARHPSK